MADILTMLENKLDELYSSCVAQISDSNYVPSWDDYNHRAGFLKAIRTVGNLIKEVRSPEMPPETGEIPSILDEGHILNG